MLGQTRVNERLREARSRRSSDWLSVLSRYSPVSRVEGRWRCDCVSSALSQLLPSCAREVVERPRSPEASSMPEHDRSRLCWTMDTTLYGWASRLYVTPLGSSGSRYTIDVTLVVTCIVRSGRDRSSLGLAHILSTYKLGWARCPRGGLSINTHTRTQVSTPLGVGHSHITGRLPDQRPPPAVLGTLHAARRHAPCVRHVRSAAVRRSHHPEDGHW